MISVLFLLILNNVYFGNIATIDIIQHQLVQAEETCKNDSICFTNMAKSILCGAAGQSCDYLNINEKVDNCYYNNVDSISKIRDCLQGLVELFSEPKENIQYITLGNLEETRSLAINEYLAYSFLSDNGNKISVDVDVISDGDIDTFITDSSQFSNFQSMMKSSGNNIKTFKSYDYGLKIKSKHYTISFDHGDRYYIIINNGISFGNMPTGPVNVKVKITEDHTSSGLEFVYSLMIFIIIKKFAFNLH